MSPVILIVAVLIFVWVMLKEGFVTIPPSDNILFGIVPTTNNSNPKGLQ